MKSSCSPCPQPGPPAHQQPPGTGDTWGRRLPGEGNGNLFGRRTGQHSPAWDVAGRSSHLAAGIPGACSCPAGKPLLEGRRARPGWHSPTAPLARWWPGAGGMLPLCPKQLAFARARCHLPRGAACCPSCIPGHGIPPREGSPKWRLGKGSGEMPGAAAWSGLTAGMGSAAAGSHSKDIITAPHHR